MDRRYPPALTATSFLHPFAVVSGTAFASLRSFFVAVCPPRQRHRGHWLRSVGDHHHAPTIWYDNVTMFALRCTQKLLARLNAKPASIPRTPTTRLGDWYANLVVRRPVHLVVAVSERTLLPVIIEAAPGGTVMPRLGAAVSDVLRRIGIREDAVAAEYGAMRDVVFAKTESKRVLGSLTEFVGMLGFYLEDGDTNLIDISVQLADTPCSPIAYESPKARTVALFESRDPTKME